MNTTTTTKRTSRPRATTTTTTPPLRARLPTAAAFHPAAARSGGTTSTTTGVVALLLLLLQLWLGVSMAAGGARAEGAPGGAQGPHDCQHNLQYTSANCSGRGLDRVPWGLHHNLDTLDLCHNGFTSLEPNAFKGYSNLRVLRLCHNSIRDLHRDSLGKLTRLHSLDLSSNLLSDIPIQVLNTLPNLLRLDLSGNNLVTVPDDAFMGLHNLKVLDLSANRITDIETNALQGLPNLQVLKLEKNALRWLAPSLFKQLSDKMLQMHLYGNPWLCDCKVRHMRQWMGNGTSSVWQQPGHSVRCEGPSISRGKALSSIPLDELACRVEMRTSGSTKTVARGKEAVMECIYFSIPYAKPIWQRNQMPINFAASPRKYSMTVEGSPVTVTRLYVRDFQYTDIMEYECLAHNIRGSDSTVFKVTLKGVPFESVVHQPPASPGAPLGLDSKSIVVGVAIVCGLILVTVFSLLIYYCVRHFRRQEQEKQDAVVESVKKHFLTSEEMASADSRAAERSKLDQLQHQPAPDSARAKEKAATAAAEGKQPGTTHEREPLYTFQQHGSPVASGNTYVSFSTEVIEPEVYPMYPQTRTSIYEESQAESKTPLLNRGTPSASDADESVDDAMHSHVYESISVYRARRSQYSDANSSTPAQSRSSHSTPVGRANTNHPDYQDYREIGHLGHAKVPKKDAPVSGKKSKTAGNPGTASEQRNSPSTANAKEFIEMVPQDSTVPHNTDEGEQ